MPLPLLRAAMEAWPDTDFMQVYGLTELGGVITHLMPEAHRDAEHPERLVSAGQCIPGAEVRVVDPVDAWRTSPAGEHGELWFRTQQLMKGYLNKPEATAEVITEDGWFRTGDMGRVDDDGFVYVEDRLKDMIISGGENIYSPEVERVLAEHPSVMEVAIIGVPDDRWGEAVKAVVSLNPGTEATEEELIAWCREQLAQLQVPASRSTSSMRCRATRRARSSSATCASPTGKATLAPQSEDPPVSSAWLRWRDELAPVSALRLERAPLRLARPRDLPARRAGARGEAAHRDCARGLLAVPALR